jgi:hypothetical protein
MQLAHPMPLGGRTLVEIKPLARGIPQVYLSMDVGGQGCGGYLNEDEARRLSQALLDGIEQSKALTAPGSG